jgi:cupin 2 domain-containing protein
MNVGNIYANLPQNLDQEVFEDLLTTKNLKLERIISKGHVTPPGEWYDQDKDEWVILLTGNAGIRIDGQTEVIDLKKGDYLLLPAHLKHRVEWTSEEEETIWLALHYIAT